MISGKEGMTISLDSLLQMNRVFRLSVLRCSLRISNGNGCTSDRENDDIGYLGKGSFSIGLTPVCCLVQNVWFCPSGLFNCSDIVYPESADYFK